jgi:primosomal protein N' (replication factor Y)
MLCHYCLFAQSEAKSCQACGSARVSWVGWGTERVEQDLRKQFPRARIARLDRDTTRRQGTLEETLERMRRRELDILVGTQILTKGHDYAHVTLVGVLLAESSLNFPDFRAAERTFQLITQVAGRAGRGERPGRVFVQGFNANHYALRYALDSNYLGFFDYEKTYRNALNYPPFHRLIQLIYSGSSEQQVQKAAHVATEKLRLWLGRNGHVLGPAPCPLEKLRGHYRWQTLIKAQNYSQVRDALQARLDVDLPNILPSNVKLRIDVDPQNML